MARHADGSLKEVILTSHMILYSLKNGVRKGPTCSQARCRVRICQQAQQHDQLHIPYGAPCLASSASI